MESIIIKNGLVVKSGKAKKEDILITDGKVACIGESIECPEDVQRFDAQGCVVCCGLADVHVHLREPGFSEKETIATGSMAAARGGYSTVCPMPNLVPAPDAPETLAEELDIIKKDAVVNVLPYATITMGRKGETVVDMEALKRLCVGFSDDGSGIQNDDVMEEAMTKAASLDLIIAAHCEDNRLLNKGYIHDGEYAKAHGHRGICSESEWGQIERDLKLVEKTGCRYHVCHISTAESVELIRQAKAKGLKVSCETGPHYLTLTDADLQEDGRFKMNPPLRSERDKAALIKGIQDGTIDMIATDHAPHTAEQKSKGLEKSAMGIVGLETAFPVTYSKLVKNGVISLERLVELMSEKPREVFRLSGALEVGQAAQIAVFDISTQYSVDSSKFVSKGKASPFDEWKLEGDCVLNICNGNIVWKKQKDTNDKQ